jgi:hypothetical protein
MRAIAGLLVAGAVSAVLSAGAPAAPQKLHGNNFFSNCRFSHISTNDPIVHPGMPGRSHSHTFFGNASTDAYSTLASLLRAPRTTCAARGDKAAYWAPTLYAQGREVRPEKAQFYYVLRGYGQMHPFPPGLRIVAGDASAVRPQSMRVTYWACGGPGVHTRSSSTAPTCGVMRVRPKGIFKMCATCKPQRLPVRNVQTRLELHVDFPDCWDGRHLDSPDHKTHMAYSTNYVCPASHPVKVPLIRMTIRYPVTDGKTVALASGGQFTGHADFFNAWDERTLAKLVATCFAGRPCDPRARR